MRALRFGDFAEMVFLFVGLDIFPRSFDFFMAGDAKAVVIVKALFRRVSTALVNDQAPFGECCLHDRETLHPAHSQASHIFSTIALLAGCPQFPLAHRTFHRLPRNGGRHGQERG